MHTVAYEWASNFEIIKRHILQITPNSDTTFESAPAASVGSRK